MAGDKSFRLYLWQRATAALMVPFIAGHLTVIFYATRHSLTAADILGRTRGSYIWAAFYGTFVLLAAIHGAIGVRSVMTDWTTASAGTRDVTIWVFGGLLIVLGMRAVMAVIAPGAA